MQARRDPAIEIGQVTIAVTDLLAREMDEISQDALHEAGTDRYSLHRQRATLANRVVVGCRMLVEDIRRYELLKQWETTEEGYESEDTLDF